LASNPAKVVNASPTSVTVTFTEVPDVKFSSVAVLDTTGRALQRGKATANGRALSVAVGELPRGVYLVTWRVLSRVDGHVTGGTFAFGVGVSPSTATVPPSSRIAPGPSGLSIAGRWVFYAGLMVLLGAGWLGAAALERAPAGLRWLGWVLAIAGAIAIGEAQRRSASIPLAQVWSSSIGRAFAWRVLPLAVGGLVLMFVRGTLGGWLITAAAAGSMLAHVAYGHAGAARPAGIAIGQQWAHFLGAGVWLGGLIALLAGMRGLEAEARARAVRAYSAVALWAAACVGTDSSTGWPGDDASATLAVQPALIPSPADGSALPINRIRAVTTRVPDQSVLDVTVQDVSPTAASWEMVLSVPASEDETVVIVFLYLRYPF